MSVAQLVVELTKLSGLVFVVSSMLAMGLSLTVPMILAPLRRWGLVAGALAVNFVIAPIAALGIAEVLSLDDALRDGLVILGLAAGAPFLPKLVQAANGDPAFSVGLMVVLMVATVVLLPLVLPWALQGASVDAWDLARSLVVLMLVPLGLALVVRAHWPDLAAQYQPVLARTSTVAVLLLVVLGIGLNVSNALDLVGTRGLLSVALLVGAGVVAGLLTGGRDPGTRAVTALGAGQRNLSAALVVASQDFAGTTTLAFVLVGSVIVLVLLLPSARAIGRICGTAPARYSGGASEGAS